MDNVIKKEKLVDLQIAHVDKIGSCYEYEGKIIRIINKSAEASTLKLLHSALIDELMKEHLLVETWQSEYVTEDGALVLEHRKINVKQHYSQWSFEMMKTAGFTALRINAICNKYGFELKDCHPGNLLFDGITPLWVDFGSIVRKSNLQWWIAQREFLQWYIYPLTLWSRGYSGVVRALYRNDMTCEFEELQSLYYGLMPRIMKKIGINLYKKENLASLEDKLSKLSLEQKTVWGDYQNEHWKNGDERFRYEIDWIKRTSDIGSVIEIAANQGAFAYLCSEEAKIKNIVATDYDVVAVDKMFHILKEKNVNTITPLIMNFVEASESELKSRCADLVVANALTHHLLLRQGLTMEAMMRRFLLLTNKYIIVEFTPKGVDKHRNPKWYTLDWFLKEIQTGFKILHMKEFTNRVVIIGEKLIKDVT